MAIFKPVKLVRSYPMKSGKTMEGVAFAIQKCLKDYGGLVVETKRIYDGYEFICKTVGAAYHAAQLDIDSEIRIHHHGEAIEFVYEDHISNIERGAEGIFVAPFFLGAPMLAGISRRHELPYHVRDAVLSYLDVSRSN